MPANTLLASLGGDGSSSTDTAEVDVRLVAVSHSNNKKQNIEYSAACDQRVSSTAAQAGSSTSICSSWQQQQLEALESSTPSSLSQLQSGPVQHQHGHRRDQHLAVTLANIVFGLNVFLFALFLLISTIRYPDTSTPSTPSQAPGSFPSSPASSSQPAAAFVAVVLSDANARLTVIASYAILGIGFSMACIVMVLSYLRLAVYKIPPAALIVSAFVPLGPCGQGAFCILKLASVVYDISKSSGVGLTSAVSDPRDAVTMATAILGVSIPLALAIWGWGLAWLTLATLTLLDLALVSKLPFNPSWWAFTFPLGVWCTATNQLAKELDSATFRFLGTLFSVIEILLWLFVSVLTIRNALVGNLFLAPDTANKYGGEWPPKYVPRSPQVRGRAARTQLQPQSLPHPAHRRLFSFQQPIALLTSIRALAFPRAADVRPFRPACVNWNSI
ncbi:hypothetical protein V8E36_005098 [Tilletia maclaganii]